MRPHKAAGIITLWLFFGGLRHLVPNYGGGTPLPPPPGECQSGAGTVIPF